MAIPVKHIISRLGDAAIAFIQRIAVLFLLFLLLRVFEITYDAILHGPAVNMLMVLVTGIVKDTSFLARICIWLFLLYGALYMLNKKTAQVVFIVFSIVLCLIQVSLVQYFLTTLVPLGGDLWAYSIKDIKQTVGAAGGIPTSAIIIFLVFIALIITALVIVPRKIRVSRRWALLIVLAFCIFVPFNIADAANNIKPSRNEYSNNLSTNKSYFFYTASFIHLFPPDNDLDIYSDAYSGDFEGVAPSSAVAFT